MRLRRTPKTQAGRAAIGAVVAPQGKRAGAAGLVQRIRGVLVRRSVERAVRQAPAAAALVFGIALGVMIGAALMLSAIVAAAREAS